MRSRLSHTKHGRNQTRGGIVYLEFVSEFEFKISAKFWIFCGFDLQDEVLRGTDCHRTCEISPRHREDEIEKL